MTRIRANRRVRLVAAGALATGALLLAGCGSSGASSTAVPNVTGMTPGKAIGVLCSDGFRVAHTIYAAGKSTPAYSASPATSVSHLEPGLGRVDRTDPAAGTQVVRGSVITLHTSGSAMTLYASNAGCAQ
jgi:beta-lactam-binding protein with PASTA domain